LQLIYVIKDIEDTDRKFEISYNTSPVIVVSCSSIEKNTIKIGKCNKIYYKL